jgi:hypothetical protein
LKTTQTQHMKINYLSFVLVVAACIGCGGNNPVPTKGMFNSGLTAEGIQFNQNNHEFTNKQPSFTRTIVPRTQLDNNITPKDDFADVKNNYIISPAQQFDVPKEHFEIQAEAGGTIRYDKTGSTVMIPPDALVDKNGNQVKGDVDILYREFHTPKEIFFSGIPMDYDVNGEKCFFESAGMIDISASQNGEEVFIKKGKEIKFNMSTDNTHQEVKLYELDKTQKKWKELGEAPVITTDTKVATKQKQWLPVYKSTSRTYLGNSNVFLSINRMDIGIDPVTKKKEKYLTIGIRINHYQNRNEEKKENEQKYKDAKVFGKLSFVVKGMNRRHFRKMMANLNMPDGYRDDFKITELTRIDFVDPEFPNKVTLRFTYKEKQVDMPVDIRYAYNMSTKRKTKYFNTFAAFNMNEFPGRAQEKTSTKQIIDHYDSVDVQAVWTNKSIVQREFTSRSFGILNCDQPQSLPTGMVANAAFNTDDKPILPSDVCLVDFDKNTLFTYYSYMFPKFQFNPNTRNFVFTILNDGNVAFMLPDEFTSIQKEGDMKLNLHVISIDEFEKVMEALFPSKNEQSYML